MNLVNLTIAVISTLLLSTACGGGGDDDQLPLPLPAADFCESPDYGRLVNGEIVQFASGEQYEAWLAAGNDQCRVALWGNTVE